MPADNLTSFDVLYLFYVSKRLDYDRISFPDKTADQCFHLMQSLDLVTGTPGSPSLTPLGEDTLEYYTDHDHEIINARTFVPSEVAPDEQPVVASFVPSPSPVHNPQPRSSTKGLGVFLVVIALACVLFFCFLYSLKPSSPSPTSSPVAAATVDTAALAHSMLDRYYSSTPTPKPTTKPSYIGNRKTKKFHLSTCSSVDQMDDKNKVTFKSRQAAIDAGYDRCQRCYP